MARKQLAITTIGRSSITSLSACFSSMPTMGRTDVFEAMRQIHPDVNTILTSAYGADLPRWSANAVGLHSQTVSHSRS